MKTLKLFSLIACMILCGLTANAQTKVLQTPDEAEYFIKGDHLVINPLTIFKNRRLRWDIT